MSRFRLSCIVAAALSLALVGALPSRAQDEPAAPAAPAAPAEPRVSFSDLIARVRALRAEEQQLAQQREAEKRAILDRQLAAAAAQEARRDREEARSDDLNARWEANSDRIDELTLLLAQKQGNLGELFGVTRQVAGDAANVLQESMLSAQYRASAGDEERVEFLRRLAGVQALPSIAELERMWYELSREMTDAAKVQRFPATILHVEDGAEPAEGEEAAPVATTEVEASVVRIGPFTAVSDGEFLGYLQSTQQFTVLDGRMPGEFRRIARELENAPAGSGHHLAVVDPARGALLSLYLERPDWIARIEEGDVVGYIIVAVGIVGVILALFQFGYLLMTRLAVASQLARMDQPKKDNPLGRILQAFREGGTPNEPRELAELRLSEAVLRELPKLERFQALLRLFVAAGPLLGLIGTVVGMIITFQAITSAGTSDPRLMADGIGKAMIATVLGLGIAIPLLFINAGLTAFSRGITQILDEKTHELLAQKS